MEDTTVDEKTREQAKLVGTSLGNRIMAMFSQAERERVEYETRWIDNLRMYRGKYHPDIAIKIQKNRSKAFLNLCKIKVNAMDSRLLDMMFPGGVERNWSIKHTPEPELSPTKIIQIAQELTANEIEPDDQSIDAYADEVAKKAAEKMSTAIADQLTEGKYKRKCRAIFHSGHIFGTGVLKGPLSEIKTKAKWVEAEAGEEGGGGFYQKQVQEDTETAYFDRVRLWDFYPDLSARGIEDADYAFERHLFRKHDLRELAARPDFDQAAISKFVREHPEGNATRKNWETSVKDLNDAMAAVADLNRKYEVIEGWLYVDGADLRDYAGMDISEEEVDEMFIANIWVLGGEIIKAELSPYKQISLPYHLYYYERDDDSIFGIGIPEVIEGSQDLVNASNRAMVDNAAASAGPIFEVNTDLLHPGESAQDMHPWRVILRNGRGEQARFPAVKVHVVPNNVTQLKQLVEFFKMFVDELSSIPSYMHGESDKGVGKTVGGLSMLMGAATMTVKDVVANFDEGITVPFLTGIYEWNMLNNPDEEIKGDMNVKAQGSTTLMAREVRVQQLDYFSNVTANPIDQAYINRGKLLREQAKARELPEDILRPQEETDYIQQLEGQLEELMLKLEGMGHAERIPNAA